MGQINGELINYDLLDIIEWLSDEELPLNSADAVEPLCGSSLMQKAKVLSFNAASELVMLRTYYDEMSKLNTDTETSKYKWLPANQLPTPKIPLKIMLGDGTVVNGSRPDYISSRTVEDTGYRSDTGERLTNVTYWAIR